MAPRRPPSLLSARPMRAPGSSRAGKRFSGAPGRIRGSGSFSFLWDGCQGSAQGAAHRVHSQKAVLLPKIARISSIAPTRSRLARGVMLGESYRRRGRAWPGRQWGGGFTRRRASDALPGMGRRKGDITSAANGVRSGTGTRPPLALAKSRQRIPTLSCVPGSRASGYPGSRRSQMDRYGSAQLRRRDPGSRAE